MKLNGKKLDTPNEEIIVIPRGTRSPIVFRARAVLSYDEFHEIYPEPEPPKMKKPGSEDWFEDRQDVDYKEAIKKRNTAEFHWMIFQSLLATPELEFETVLAEDPNSWSLIEEELQGAGFTVIEINRIIQGVLQANCLDEKKLEEARNSFMLSQADQ